LHELKNATRSVLQLGSGVCVRVRLRVSDRIGVEARFSIGVRVRVRVRVRVLRALKISTLEASHQETQHP